MVVIDVVLLVLMHAARIMNLIYIAFNRTFPNSHQSRYNTVYTHLQNDTTIGHTQSLRRRSILVSHQMFGISSLRILPLSDVGGALWGRY
ncbi:hypothetical protein EDD85DRAFT_882426 [Armillaria nabsnona]|nr:hypothetical protein EDD85DRAFT_882426 [Armillaria nabsnona]